MAKLPRPFRPKKYHKYWGLHGLTQGCWWFGISIALNFSILFMPDTAQSAIISFAGAGIIFVLSHRHGKKCHWI